MATKQQHVEDHIKSLRVALAHTDDPRERAHIQRQIAEYQKEKQMGYVHEECEPFVEDDE